MGENSRSSTKHPPLNELVALLCSLGIKKLRIPHPDHNLFKALINTNLEVNLGIPNEDLLNLALSYEHALQWVDNNIKPYLSSLKIQYITVGNEVFKGEERLWYLVLPAMQNVHKALHSLDKDGFSIHVSTSVGMDVLDAARFRNDLTPFIQPIVEFLAENKLPLMVNVFSYKKSDGTAASCSYDWTNALGKAVEAFYRAMEWIGYPSVLIVVSSTGFPSVGGEPNVATRANTLAYNQCLERHNRVERYYSNKSELPIQFYLFTLVNSKSYPGDKLEWGLFDFNMCLIYRQGFFS